MAMGPALADDALEAMSVAGRVGSQIDVDVFGPSLQSIGITVTL